MFVPSPIDEARRLVELDRLSILDSPPEQAFDRLTRLAAALFDAPIALVSFVDETRQWFKSCLGVPVTETSRDVSFCAHVVVGIDTLVVEDASLDPRFANNPFVRGESHIRFYAGAPLRTAGDAVVGTFCIVDTKPRTFGAAEIALLEDFADATVEALEHRLVRDGARRAIYAEHRALVATKAVVDAVPLSICTLDAQRRVLTWNPAAERIFGVTAREAVGAPLASVVRDDSGDLARLAAESTPQRPVSGVRLELERADAARIVLSVATASLVDERDGSARTILVSEDVTAREAAARALATADARLRSFAETATDAFVAADGVGRIAYWNAAAERMFGHSSAEALGRHLKLIVPSSRYAEYVAAMLASLEHEGCETVEITLNRKSGEEFYAELATSTWRSGDEVFYAAAIRDVSRRKQVEAELEHMAAEYHGLIDNARDAMIVFAPEGERILEANLAACAFYGYPHDELVGRSLLEFSEDTERGARHVEATFASTDRYQFETVHVRRDGERRHLEISASAVRWHGEPAILSLNRDVTERKDAEEALKRSEELLRHAQKMEAVGMLAGGIAHDFNNLLTVINGYGAIALRQLPKEDRLSEMIREMVHAGEHAADLTRQLLAFSRRQVLKPRSIDLNAVVADLGKMLARLIGEHVEIVTRLDARLGMTVADPGQLEQVIVNLAVNARDAMPDGGRLTIETHNVEAIGADDALGLGPGEYVTLTVRDTGSGMDAETLAQVFDPFFTTKEMGKGTGLGLATVYGIVAQSGGSIGVESEVGTGTSFTIFLPRTLEADDALVEAEPDAPESGHETVLLAEDDEMVRGLVAETLESFGYRVLAAGDGEEALEVADAYDGAIDLVLSDVVMPRKNGVDLARELNRRHGWIPILLMTGYPDGATDKLDEGEVMRVIGKPFKRDELARAVREALDASAHRHPMH